MQIGGRHHGKDRAEFVVWAPMARKMEVRILSPEERLLPMTRLEKGYWRTETRGVPAGAAYFFRIDESAERPDPASAFQPEGVHGPSALVDHGSFDWSDEDWSPPLPEDWIVYELHVGTFTPEGTFEAVIPRLKELRELGVTAVEIMPASQFPGERGWGYDGVNPFAPQNTYGGPEGLKRLVDACHSEGLAFILDVVYNHLGPEGNYLWDYGPYFTDRYHTPWGDAVNMDGAGSDEVRRYFIGNAVYWLRDYHIDALRLDATDRIYDVSAKHFLRELSEDVRDFARKDGKARHLFVENELNDVRIIRPLEEGGYGLDVHWNDDFHHALHTLLTKEGVSYYQDFGRAADLAKAFREGYVYDWRYSRYLEHRRGSSSVEEPARQFLVCSQNHDQVGNRMFGHRLISLSSFEGAKTAAGAVILSPFIPLLFMGEEYGEDNPFQFFASFQDKELRDAVSRGRKNEFASFKWRDEAPDPHDMETFNRSCLDWDKRHRGDHKIMLEFYRTLLALRREIPALRHLDKNSLEAGCIEDDRVVWIRRQWEDSQIMAVFVFNDHEVTFTPPIDRGTWSKRIDSAATHWHGPGSSLPERIQREHPLTFPPMSCTLFIKE